MKKAFIKGVKAYVAGHAMSSNPNAYPSKRQQQWDNGFVTAMIESRFSEKKIRRIPKGWHNV